MLCFGHTAFVSGHSKWSQIKRKKAVVDAKRSQAFAKLAREISQAARAGADPKANPGLARAIDRALSANMPKDNIDRALSLASDRASHQTPLLLEAYGPGGVGLIIQATTDNKNRALAEIKHILSQHNIPLGGTNSVLWQFEQRGDQFIAKQSLTLSPEDQQKLTELSNALANHPDVTSITTTA